MESTGEHNPATTSGPFRPDGRGPIERQGISRLNDSDLVSLELAVGGDDGHIENLSLGDQKSVERVTVVIGQLRHTQDVRVLDRQRPGCPTVASCLAHRSPGPEARAACRSGA